MISNSSTLQMQTNKHYQRFSIILIAVMLGHLLVFWCMLKMIQPYTFTPPPVIQSMRIHFVSLTEIRQVQPQSIQLKTSTIPPATPLQSARNDIIHSTKSTKTLEKKTVQVKRFVQPDVVPMQKAIVEPTIGQGSQQAISSQVMALAMEVENPVVTPRQENQANKNQGLHAQRHDESQGQHQAELSSQIGLNQQLNKSFNQPVVEQQPLRVSNIDVLSFGAIKYDERILNHQERILILTLFVDQQGAPTKILVKQSSGIHSLDQIVIKAAEKASFKPYKVNGKAMPIVVDYPFQLKPNLSR